MHIILRAVSRGVRHVPCPIPPAAPDVLLFIATGCAHCPAVLAALSELVKQGAVGRLEVVNIAARPEAAQIAGVRSVPWMRIGPFTLQGSHTPAELRQWVERAARGKGVAEYLGELIENQRLDEALAALRAHPEWLHVLPTLIADLEVPMGVRIGVGALLEDLAEHDELEPLLPALRALLQAPEPQVRADAAYYLGLSKRAEVRDWLAPLREDPDADGTRDRQRGAGGTA